MPETAIILISHQKPESAEAMVRTWQSLNPSALVHLAYGGTREQFKAISVSERTFVADIRLRTKDHPRERQSYQGLMRAVCRDLASRDISGLLMVEFDVAPLRAGLVDYLQARSQKDRADVMGVNLRRIDGTNHAHYLAHAASEGFSHWLDFSVRNDKSVVMMMLGCLTWWTWDAFSRTAEQPETFPVYLELAMPTVAHHLGFRVRGLPEFQSDVVVMGERGDEFHPRKLHGAWVLHPCKKFWNDRATTGFQTLRETFTPRSNS